MINIALCYAVTWLFVFALYELGWSSLNIPLTTDLVVFFTATIIISLVAGMRKKQTKPFGIVWKKRVPIVTIGLAVGFFIGLDLSGGTPALPKLPGI
jgi:hypothetical protein